MTSNNVGLSIAAWSEHVRNSLHVVVYTVECRLNKLEGTGTAVNPNPNHNLTITFDFSTPKPYHF